MSCQNVATIKQPKGKNKPNSIKINQKTEEISYYQGLLKQNGIFYEYPEVKLHPDEPMLGHTKGNTKNNRKKLKKHQEIVADVILQYLKEMVTKHKLIDGIVYHYEYNQE